MSRPLRVYVAGASTDAELAREQIRMLTESGVDVTLDWTAEVIERRARGQHDGTLSRAEAFDSASADLDGVARADVLWLILPSESSIGCWVELGAALAQGVPAIVSGTAARRTIFTAPTTTFLTHAEARSHIILRNARQVFT